MLEQNEFGFISHEHLCYFTLANLKSLLEKCGFYLFDVKLNSSNGGSIRVFFTPNHQLLSFPENLKIDFFQDESKSINSMISDLENNVILAVLLVLIIIIFWMGFKSAILVSISIPGSFLISMVFLSFMGVTINVVVLFSLILSVGILIDGAIIVVEYANRRASEGLNNKEVFIGQEGCIEQANKIVLLPALHFAGVLHRMNPQLPGWQIH